MTGLNSTFASSGGKGNFIPFQGLFQNRALWTRFFILSLKRCWPGRLIPPVFFWMPRPFLKDNSQNYAFPELGVMLNSLIYRKKKKVQEGEGSYDSWVYEYERPAVSAIEELAPANKFYAGKRKVTIDQVDMTVSELETWRFCNNCSHKILVGKEEETETCTSCGSTMWADEGRKRLMLRMRQVFASTRDRESRISDDSDDRDPTLYNKQMLLEFDEKEVLDAYQIEGDTPFGFDFLAKADFCKINFGEKTEIGEKTAIEEWKYPGPVLPYAGYAARCKVITNQIIMPLPALPKTRKRTRTL